MIQEKFPRWSPTEVARHYGFPTGRYTGKGQSVAVISLGGPVDMSELQQDFDGLQVAMPRIRELMVDPQSFDPAQNRMSSGETHLDVEVIGCICPDAEITIYRGANPHGFAAAVASAVKDRQSVISISWGTSESTLADCAGMEAALKDARDAGLTVCASSGDWGSSNARNRTGKAGAAADGKAHVEYPASSPWVLSCGGTELVNDGRDDFEIVWNNVERNSGATGGGVSELFPVPDWQSRAGVDIPSANGGARGRVMPDVSGLAAGGDWMIYADAQGRPTGGTSAVAPLWAAFIVMVNEARQAAGKNRLGFFNDRLYPLAAAGGLFNEVSSGTNRPSPEYPGYDAGPGFNACTGWGTPVGDKLFHALTGLD